MTGGIGTHFDEIQMLWGEKKEEDVIFPEEGGSDAVPEFRRIPRQ